MRFNKIKDVHVGQKIKIKCSNEEDGRRLSSSHKTITVVAIYPNHVLTKDVLGIKRSLDYGTLIIMGLEKQAPDYEAKKIVKGEDGWRWAR